MCAARSNREQPMLVSHFSRWTRRKGRCMRSIWAVKTFRAVRGVRGVRAVLAVRAVRPTGAAAALCACVLALAASAPAQTRAQGAQRRATPAAGKSAFFTTPLTLDQMKNKQAVVETSVGTIVIQLLPEAAPNHVGYFMK